MTRTTTALLAALVTAGTLGALSLADPQPALTGEAVAVDGDTLRLNGQRIRLAGIDAPEAEQMCRRPQNAAQIASEARTAVANGYPPTNAPGASRAVRPSYAPAEAYPCGALATAALRHMLDRDPLVSCEVRDRDHHGRIVAVCRNGEGDLAARMVATGHAVAYRRYSTAYIDQEAAARAERLGLWAGAFVNPEQWRREHTKRQ